jgi:hypothetical protein
MMKKCDIKPPDKLIIDYDGKLSNLQIIINNDIFNYSLDDIFFIWNHIHSHKFGNSNSKITSNDFLFIEKVEFNHYYDFKLEIGLHRMYNKYFLFYNIRIKDNNIFKITKYHEINYKNQTFILPRKEYII